MPTPTWRGSEAVHLQPGYPRFKRDSGGASLELQFGGPTSALKTYGPAIGDSITLGAFDYEPSDELVYADVVDCRPNGAGDDGPGTLIVIYTNNKAVSEVASEPEESIEEVDSSLLEKPLEAHKRYNEDSSFGVSMGDEFDLNSPTDTITVGEFWDRYKHASLAERKALRARVPPDGDGPAVIALIDDIARKWGRGQQSYMVPAPICRLTSFSYEAPTVAEVGTVGGPGFGPGGYQWLKTADRGMRQGGRGKWQRIEEWTGADYWDTELYS